MEWTKGEVIGRGSFGTVNLATLTNLSNTPQTVSVVVKSSHISKSSSLKNEKEVLTKLGNRNRHVVQYLGDSVSEEKGAQNYNLFLEYASKGSLADYLRKSEGKIGNNNNLKGIKKYIRGILSGLCYVHENGFVHGDVKLTNVLVFEDEDEDEVVKLADFGLARRVDDDDEERKLRGTPLYMSPEIVAGKVVTTAVDVWAVGCAVVEMVSGFPVWDLLPENDVSGLFYRIGVKGECPRIPLSLCDDGKDFLEKCFKKDPSERWTARMLLEHPFLCGSLSDSLSEKSDVSPKCPFEFPDWESSSDGSGFGSGSVESFDSVFEFSSITSVSCRFEEGVVSDVVLDWSDSDGWVTVR